MSQLFDTSAIARTNSPEAVFARLSIDVVRRGTRLTAACPQCGKDKKFDYNLDKDVFYCFSCQFGEGHKGVIGLVMAVQGLDFVAACQFLGGAKRLSPSEQRAAETRRRDFVDRQNRREAARLRRTGQKMEDILGGCQPLAGTLAETYLRTRERGRGYGAGIDALGGPEAMSDVLFHPGLEAWIGEGDAARPAGVFPAMVARGRDRQGKLVLLHRTYLMETDFGAAKAVPPVLPSGFTVEDWSPKQMLGVLSRCERGVYLGRSPDVRLGQSLPVFVAEGIESALAGAAAGLIGDFYAALALGRLTGRVDSAGHHDSGWLPPDTSRPVVIMADNDLSGTSQNPDGVDRAQQSFARAKSRIASTGAPCAVVSPPAGLDPADWYLEKDAA